MRNDTRSESDARTARRSRSLSCGVSVVIFGVCAVGETIAATHDVPPMPHFAFRLLSGFFGLAAAFLALRRRVTTEASLIGVILGWFLTAGPLFALFIYLALEQRFGAD